MINYEFHKIPLNYGRTDGKNIPLMQDGKFFCVGYNLKYGLVDVCEDNGNPFFEGRVNIESLLSKIELNGQKVDQKAVDSQVENFIMKAYNNSMGDRNIPNECASSSTPALEILTYKG